MGFDKEVSAILTSIKKSVTGSLHKCQTVLLSATLSKGEFDSIIIIKNSHVCLPIGRLKIGKII